MLTALRQYAGPADGGPPVTEAARQKLVVANGNRSGAFELQYVYSWGSDEPQHESSSMTVSGATYTDTLLCPANEISTGEFTVDQNSVRFLPEQSNLEFTFERR